MIRIAIGILIILMLLLGLRTAATSSIPDSTSVHPESRNVSLPNEAPIQKLVMLPVAQVDSTLDGEWHVESVESSGEIGQNDESGATWEFQGDEITIHEPNNALEERRLRFTLVPQSPMAIDITSDEKRDSTIAGIYSIDGSVLKLCRSLGNPQNRPSNFKTEPGDGLQLLVLQRIAVDQTNVPAGSREFNAVQQEATRAENEFRESCRNARSKSEIEAAKFQREKRLQTLAERCLEIGERHPKSPVAIGALGWAAEHAFETNAGFKARAALIQRIPQDDLGLLVAGFDDYARLQDSRLRDIAPVLLERVNQNPQHARAARLFRTICVLSRGAANAEPDPSFSKAADLLIEYHADAPRIENFCGILGCFGDVPRWAGQYERHVRAILAQNQNRSVQTCALFALASIAQLSVDRQKEALELYQRFLDSFDGSLKYTFTGIEEHLISKAKQNMKEIESSGVGKPASEIVGMDLDGNPFKLADYRGKVVLLTFWATWCGPCMQMIPHEQTLQKRLEGKPFAIVGVNGDRDDKLAKRAVAEQKISWRSFRNKRQGKPTISAEWNCQGWPTRYLIDQTGLVRQRWNGDGYHEEISREIDRLLDPTAG